VKLGRYRCWSGPSLRGQHVAERPQATIERIVSRNALSGGDNEK
jgi:hypothetical protein